MKKTTLILALGALSFNAICQNSFGEILYNHTNSFLTSGTVTSISPGFLMVGTAPVVPAGSNNFFIDRTDIGGGFTGSPQEFQFAYKLMGTSACINNPPQILNCAGISACESSTSLFSRYILAGAMDFGCFFAAIQGNGFQAGQTAYLFPGALPKLNVSKPLIFESIQTPGNFYIVGSYDGIMYILKVNTVGTIVAQRTYFIPSGVALTPNAILESPYFPFDLTVVGNTSKMPSTGLDGFFFQIDNTLTTVSNFNTYDMSSFGGNNNGFSSIKEAQSITAGGNGFIVGGYASGSSFPGSAWIMKLDQTGSIPLWSTVISGALNPSSGDVKAVAERYSTFNSGYEYYGSCAAGSGLSVYKLDDWGVPFSIGFSQNDEYVYNNGGSSVTVPVDMTFLNTGAPNDEGLHLFGNYNSTPGTHFFTQAYFNGVDGCNLSTNIANYLSTNPIVTPQNIVSHTLLSVCPGFTVTIGPNSPGYNPVCGPANSVVGGNNNKPLTINEIQKNEGSLGLSPNPSNEIAKINFIPSRETFVIKLSNSLGQTLSKIDVEPNTNSYQIDLRKLGLESGIYFVNANINGVEYKQKLIYKNQ